MSPRGVAIPGLRQQLFQATERVLVRAGPGGLTGRAITREAGCSTGLLYNHFNTLEANLTEAAVTLPGSNLPAPAICRDDPIGGAASDPSQTQIGYWRDMG